MNYIGDFLEDAVIDLMWNTNDGSGASITRTVDGSIRIYKDNGTSEKTTANGITDSEDFDTLTGVHHLRIDTGNDTGDGGFWVTGSDYFVVLATATIDGQTVNHAIAQFSIENRFDEVDVTQWLGTAVATPNTAGVPLMDLIRLVGGLVPTPTTTGVPDVNVERWLDVLVTLATTTQKPEVDAFSISDDAAAANNAEADYDGTGYNKSNSEIGTVAVNTDMRGTNSAFLASVGGALADAASAGDPTSADTIMQYLKQVINTLEGAVGIPVFPSEAAPANNVSLAEAIFAIYNDTVGLAGSAMRGTESAALAADYTAARAGYLDNINGHTPQTGDSYARLGAPAGVDVSADIAAVQSDTDDLQSRTPAALIGGRMDSDVEAINNNATAAQQLALSANEIESGACEGTPTTTTIQTDLAETQDDIYIGRVVIFTSGSARGEATDITDYTGSSGTLEVTALANAPSASDTFILI